MTFTVTVEGIILLLLQVLGLIVGGYLLVVLKNANQLILNVNKTLTANQEKLDKLLLNLEELSGNTAHVSGELKNQFETNKVIISSIFQTGADSMFLINDATSRIRTLVSNFNEIVRLVNGIIKKVK
ncbi:hypothetical protein [Desulfocastanea catecholica]